jgi:transposase
MENSNTGIPEQTIGLDVSDKYTEFMVLDRAGEVLETGRVKTSEAGLSRLTRAYPQARIALEVGVHSGWMSRAFTAWGHAEVLIANSAKLAAISQSRSKSDRHDAEMLARLARTDFRLLRPLQHRARETQLLLAQVRARRSLVEARTKLINAVRGLTKSFGAPLKKCSAESFHRQAARDLPAELKRVVRAQIVAIAILTVQIRRAECELEQIAHELPVTSVLRQVAGVGLLTALTYVLTIEDPHRFRHSRDVGAYLGLTPRRHQSGDCDPSLRITKAGSSELRALLIQAAHYILGPFGPETRLRAQGQKIAARRGARTAITAVARKLAVLLHRLWITGESYDPSRTGMAKPTHASSGLHG